MLSKASARSGTLITQQRGEEGYKAFIPKPLPPDPPLKFDDEIKELEERANRVSSENHRTGSGEPFRVTRLSFRLHLMR